MIINIVIFFVIPVSVILVAFILLNEIDGYYEWKELMKQDIDRETQQQTNNKGEMK